jgi:hypothetical protein
MRCPYPYRLAPILDSRLKPAGMTAWSGCDNAKLPIVIEKLPGEERKISERLNNLRLHRLFSLPG